MNCRLDCNSLESLNNKLQQTEVWGPLKYLIINLHNIIIMMNRLLMYAKGSSVLFLHVSGGLVFGILDVFKMLKKSGPVLSHDTLTGGDLLG